MMRVALIGLGEVGTVLAQDLDAKLSTWDTAFDRGSPASDNAASLGLSVSPSAVAAVRDADLVISAVTAANDLAAAADAAPGLPDGCWFLDLNSASPSQKRAAAEVVTAAGGRYVEAAVMSPITPKRLTAPVLLGGPHAEEFAAVARDLGFVEAKPYSETVGVAAATKLCRSVVIKGMEALLTESLLAARVWGVEAEVLASLGNLLPGVDWSEHAAYMVSRALVHGARRAEELREAAAMVSATGDEPVMADAVARRQDWAATNRDTLAPMIDALKDRKGAR